MAEFGNIIVRVAAEQLSVNEVVLSADLDHRVPHVIVEVVSCLFVADAEVLHVQLFAELVS